MRASAENRLRGVFGRKNLQDLKKAYFVLSTSSAPQDFGMLGVFCARFPPREASLLNI